MATLTLAASFDGLWPADSLAGGVIGTRLATRMVYVSDLGFTVTVRGTGLVYDDDGRPAGGIITSIVVEKAGTIHATLAGLQLDFGRAGMQLFGYENQWGPRDPDPYSLIQNALLGGDLITGSAGWDDIRGGTGHDTINAAGGGDYVGDEAGNDVMDGGDGWDTLAYEEGYWAWGAFRGVDLDAATGTALDCWGFTDQFQNFESFKDSPYADTLKGADIDESFYLSRGNDIANGRGGDDWAMYDQAHHFGARRGILVDMSTGLVRDSWKGTDTLSNIEGVRGTKFADVFLGSSGTDGFNGDQGVDRYDGGAGADRLVFWSVGDNDDGGHGVTVNLGLATEVVDDGYGNAENADRMEDLGGSRLNDRLTGNSGTNYIWGYDGNDTLNGAGGNDDLAGEWGRDSLIGGSGNDSLGGGGDNDTMSGGSGADDFFFGWDLADTGLDRITDFVSGTDGLWVGSWWGGGFSSETLVANQFRSGAGVATANSATQRFIYNTATGDLYFDADGNGTAFSAIRFAVLSNQAALSFNDIHIMF